jgi:hypothetical protein
MGKRSYPPVETIKAAVAPIGNFSGLRGNAGDLVPRNRWPTKPNASRRSSIRKVSDQPGACTADIATGKSVGIPLGYMTAPGQRASGKDRRSRAVRAIPEDEGRERHAFLIRRARIAVRPRAKLLSRIMLRSRRGPTQPKSSPSGVIDIDFARQFRAL